MRVTKYNILEYNTGCFEKDSDRTYTIGVTEYNTILPALKKVPSLELGPTLSEGVLRALGSKNFVSLS